MSLFYSRYLIKLIRLEARELMVCFWGLEGNFAPIGREPFFIRLFIHSFIYFTDIYYCLMVSTPTLWILLQPSCYLRHSSPDRLKFQLLQSAACMPLGLDIRPPCDRVSRKTWLLPLGHLPINSGCQGTSLVIQWLRLHAPNAGGLGSIPGQGCRN